MSGPDAPEPRAAGRVPGALLRGFLQGGRVRSAVLLGIFALVLFGARGAPDGEAPPAVREASASAAQVVPAPRTAPSVGTPRSPLPEATPEAVALDNLLARYDALIRLLEARSIASPEARADSALAELRALRGRTYEAARRAVERTSPPTTRR
ncbi:MAG TPA: hypothetical protein VFR81_29880 [Longimicrobium sp.]|nr:hypothetical protein [Longimicrobium sp.]